MVKSCAKVSSPPRAVWPPHRVSSMYVNGIRIWCVYACVLYFCVCVYVSPVKMPGGRDFFLDVAHRVWVLGPCVYYVYVVACATVDRWVCTRVFALGVFSLSRVWALRVARVSFDILSDQNDTKETWIYPVLRPGSVTVGLWVSGVTNVI